MARLSPASQHPLALCVPSCLRGGLHLGRRGSCKEHVTVSSSHVHFPCPFQDMCLHPHPPPSQVSAMAPQHKGPRHVDFPSSQLVLMLSP